MAAIGPFEPRTRGRRSRARRRAVVHGRNERGTPLDSGEDPRPKTLDMAVRAQAYRGALIVGASYLNSRAYAEGPWVEGRTAFGGVDARWMQHGVQLRGEWLFGRPFNGVATYGGYVILGAPPAHGTFHSRRTSRAPRLRGRRALAYMKRYTAGARVRITRNLSLQVNVLHQPGGFTDGRRLAADVGLTNTIRF